MVTQIDSISWGAMIDSIRLLLVISLALLASDGVSSWLVSSSIQVPSSTYGLGSSRLTEIFEVQRLALGLQFFYFQSVIITDIQTSLKIGTWYDKMHTTC